MVSEKILSPEDVIFLSLFIFIFSIFLLQALLSRQLLKKNQQHNSLKRSNVVFAKTISIVAFLLAVILIVAVVAGVVSFEMYATKQQLRNKAGFILTVFIVIISGLAAIINCIYYFKTIKQNKLIVNSVINNIGISL